MSETKHTPGPWSVERHSSTDLTVRENIDGSMRPVCWIGANQPRAEGDARLIAAAPEMLAALREQPCPKAEFEGDTCDFWAAEYDQERCKRCAAIAKATNGNTA